jgi:hypothetical protein
LETGLVTERGYHDSAISVLDSGQRGVWINVSNAQDDATDAVAICLSEEEARWLEKNLRAALAAALNGEEYESNLMSPPAE